LEVLFFKKFNLRFHLKSLNGKFPSKTGHFESSPKVDNLAASERNVEANGRWFSSPISAPLPLKMALGRRLAAHCLYMADDGDCCCFHYN
jgi:hypothetical protein